MTPAPAGFATRRDLVRNKIIGPRAASVALDGKSSSAAAGSASISSRSARHREVLTQAARPPFGIAIVNPLEKRDPAGGAPARTVVARP